MGTTKAQQSMELARRLISERKNALIGTINDAESVNVNRVKSEIEKEMPDKEFCVRSGRIAAKLTKLSESYDRVEKKLKEEQKQIETELGSHRSRVAKAIEERTRKIREQATMLRHEAEQSARDAYQKLYYDALTPSNRALVQEVPTPEEFVKEHDGIMSGVKVHQIGTAAAAE